MAGLCPLPFEDALRNEGPGIRTWQFALGLSRAGHHVHLVAWRIPKAYGADQPAITETREGVSIERVDEASFFDPATLGRTIERLDPDALVGATIHGSYALARCRTALPFWADQFGHAMAEAQAKAALDGDDAVLAYYWRRVESVMRRADRVSVVSTRQKYAAIGELGALGRLSRETCGHDLVSVIPCAALPPAERVAEPLLRGVALPADAFIVLWSGGFNVWSDVETLFRGVEAAMARDARIRFVATGGAIPGQDPLSYARFSEMVASSPQRERFRLEGWVRSGDVPRYVAEADLGVLVERPIYEGELGSKNRVLQWMAAGLPVAYNRVGDLGDVIAQRELGLSFPAGDADALAERLVWAAAHGAELKALAASAREAVSSDFSVEATTRPLTSWVEAPSPAPDSSLRGSVRTPHDLGGFVTRLAQYLPAGLASLAPRQLAPHTGAQSGDGPQRPRPSAWLFVVAMLAVAPSLIWIARDRSVWPWDQANYAWNSLHLYEAIGHPRAWLRQMADCLPSWPPAIAWIGQFFVPIGRLLGSFEAGLLLSVLLTQAVSVWLVAKAVLELADGRRAVAVASALMVASPPLFVFLTTQYLTEPVQALATAWFVWIAAMAPRWTRGAILSQLVLAACFAALIKSSTPLFCLFPGLLALGSVFKQGDPADRIQWPPWRLAANVAAAGFAVLATGVWYSRHLGWVLAHVREAAGGPVAAAYGKQDAFFATLGYWLSILEIRLFTPPVLAISLALCGAAFVGLVAGRNLARRHFDRCALASILEVSLALTVFSFSANRDNRYLLALLPHLAVGLGWVLTNLRSRRWAAAVAALFACQLAWVQSEVLGLRDHGPFLSDYPRPVDEVDKKVLLEAIVRATCTESSAGRRHVIGIDLPWLNGHSATFASAKLRLSGTLRSRCDYFSFAFGSPEWAREGIMEGLDIDYFVRFDPAHYPVPEKFAFLNATAPMIFEEMRASGTLVPGPASGLPGVGIYRRRPGLRGPS